MGHRVDPEHHSDRKSGERVGFAFSYSIGIAKGHGGE